MSSSSRFSVIMILLHILLKTSEAIKRDVHKLPPPHLPTFQYLLPYTVLSLLFLWMNSLLTMRTLPLYCRYHFFPPISGYCSTKFSSLSCINFSFTIGSFPSSFKHVIAIPPLKKHFLDSILSSNYHSIFLIIFIPKSLHFWALLLFHSLLNSLPPLHLSRSCMTSMLLNIMIKFQLSLYFTKQLHLT